MRSRILEPIEVEGRVESHKQQMKTLELFVEVHLWENAWQDDRVKVTRIYGNKLDDSVLVKLSIHNNQIKEWVETKENNVDVVDH